ncbi:hypothetical protein WJX74_001121 [Apatococcus lobatus]|uniref:Uncharacterized protein n=1 Tax=Apatococcus lobatus TaxID=904363 RepID=A0AAW1S1S7_9CHLO
MPVLFCGQPTPRGVACADGWEVVPENDQDAACLATGSQTEILLQQTTGFLFTWGLAHPNPQLLPLPFPDIKGSMAATSNELVVAGGSGVSCCPLSSLLDAYVTPGQGVCDAPPEPPSGPWSSIGFPSGVNIVRLAAGEAHSIALDALGRVWAWGSNSDGQLGTGTPAASQPQPKHHSLSSARPRLVSLAGPPQYPYHHQPSHPLSDANMQSHAQEDLPQTAQTQLPAGSGVGEGHPHQQTPQASLPPLRKRLRSALQALPPLSLHADSKPATSNCAPWGADGNMSSVLLNKQPDGMPCLANAVSLLKEHGSGATSTCTWPNLHNSPVACQQQPPSRSSQEAGPKEHQAAMRAVRVGELGHLSPPQQQQKMPAHLACADIACGARHSAATTRDGRLFLWGSSLHGQCGIPGTASVWTPHEMQEAHPLQPCAVAAGLAHTCLLTAAGDAYAFGWNGQGQLGTGGTQDAHLPQLLEASSTAETAVKQVACGARHTVVLDDTGQAFSCGWNKFGQLGRRSDLIAPSLEAMTLPAELGPIGKVACGWWSSMVMTEA